MGLLSRCPDRLLHCTPNKQSRQVMLPSVSPKCVCVCEVYCSHTDHHHIITKNWESLSVHPQWMNCTRVWTETSSSRTDGGGGGLNRDRVPRFSRPGHHGPQAQREQERGPARRPVLQVCGVPPPQLDLAQAGQRSLHGKSFPPGRGGWGGDTVSLLASIHPR